MINSLCISDQLLVSLYYHKLLIKWNLTPAGCNLSKSTWTLTPQLRHLFYCFSFDCTMSKGLGNFKFLSFRLWKKVQYDRIRGKMLRDILWEHLILDFQQSHIAIYLGLFLTSIVIDSSIFSFKQGWIFVWFMILVTFYLIMILVMAVMDSSWWRLSGRIISNSLWGG